MASVIFIVSSFCSIISMCCCGYWYSPRRCFLPVFRLYCSILPGTLAVLHYRTPGVWIVSSGAISQISRIDVTEGQVGVMFVLLWTSIFGVGFWSHCIPIIGMPLKYVPFIAIMSAATLNIFRFFSIISEGGAGKAGTTVANTSVLFPAFPFGVVLTFAIMVAVRSPLNLYTSHLVLFLVTFGFVAVKVILKLVVDHMSKSEMAVADSILIGPVALFFNQYFNCPIPEYFVLWCCCILAVADTLLYSSHVCLQLADYLNIYIFRVDKPPPHPDSPQQLRDSKPGTSAPASSSFGRSTHYPGYHRSKWGPH
uniref:Choline/ethanolaminephosphotransferase 1-like n=1 Tax=Mesocestoides corti TaxID=53468 RepID=A0A5K3FKI1_MESCO